LYNVDLRWRNAYTTCLNARQKTRFMHQEAPCLIRKRRYATDLSQHKNRGKGFK